MASQLTEYERRRLENIKRNDKMMAALKIQSKLCEITSDKRKSVEMRKLNRICPAKTKDNKPVVIRRSLRSRGMPPSSTGISPDVLEASIKLRKLRSRRPQVLGPLSFRNSCSSDSDVQAFTESITSCSNGSSIGEVNGARVPNSISDSDACKFELESLRLEPDNIAVVASTRVFVVKFFPTRDSEIVVAGDEYGNVGFWDMKLKDEGNCVYRYRLHSAPVSGILVHPFSMSKVYTSSYDGMVRVMNVDKQVFDFVYSSDNAIFCLVQKPDDVNSIYWGEGRDGVVKMWDERMGKTSASWNLHEKRINSIDFNSTNANIMATSSTDGTACIWDLRKMSSKNAVMLKAIEHKQTVYSAYFSPSGTHLATTSVDGNIGVVSGKIFEHVSMIHHDNRTGTWPSSFSAIWGWDDAHLYIGNNSRGVDIVSVGQEKSICTLRSEHMTWVSCRLDAHPWKAGVLACCAAGGGKVYVWTPPSLY